MRSERLPGCRADALDGYLRALGLLVLAQGAGAALRTSWSPTGVLEVHQPDAEPPLTTLLAETELDRLLPEISTPWRGREGRDSSFPELRNGADDEALAWFDACAVPLVQAGAGKAGKRNNPLLGQGGGFGRAELQVAYDEAARLLAQASTRPVLLATALGDLLGGHEPAKESLERLSVRSKVLGAYQSGRATGPGGSRADRDPSGQQAWTSAWDLALVVAGLRSFTGSLARRAAPGAAIQTAFPLLVRGRAIALDTGNAHTLREDDADAYELLAPLWSAPARTDVVLHRLRALRVRVASGAPARDTLEAAVSHTATAAGAAGFDRLERFALFAPSDPRYRYALHRGSLTARSSELAVAAGRDLLGSLRRMAAVAGARPPERVRRARRELEETLAGDGAAASVLLGLARYEQALGQSLDDSRREGLALPLIRRSWDAMAAREGGSPWRIGRGLAWSFQTPAGSRAAAWLRGVLLGQSFAGSWRLDPARRAVDVLAGARPMEALVREALAEGRRMREMKAEPAAVRLGDIVALLSGAGGCAPEAVAEAALAAARLDELGLGDGGPDHSISRERIGRWGVDRFTALVLLAAQRERVEEPPDELLERRLRLASLALAGDRAQLLRVATASLWRRGLSVAPVSPHGLIPARRPEGLACALLLTIDPGVLHALEDRVAPPTAERGASAQHEYR